MNRHSTEALLQRIAELEARNAALEAECCEYREAIDAALDATRGTRQVARAQAKIIAMQDKAIRRATGDTSADFFASNPHVLQVIQQLYSRGAVSQEWHVETAVIQEALGVSRRTAQTAISLLRSAGYVDSCRGHGVWLTPRGIKTGRRCAAAKEEPARSPALGILATVSATG